MDDMPAEPLTLAPRRHGGAVPQDVEAASHGVARRRRRLVLALCLAVSTPVLLLAVSGWRAWQAAWRTAELELARTADAAAEYAHRLLEGQLLRLDRANDVLAGLSDAEIRAREAELHQALRRITSQRGAPSPEVTFYLFAYDRTSRPLVSSTLMPVPAGRPALDTEFAHALREANGAPFYVSPLFAGRDTGRRFFSVIARRERTGNGLPPDTYDGAISASLYVDQIMPALQALAASPADVIAFVRTDGALLARSRDAGGTPALPVRLRENSPLMEVMASGRERALVRAVSSVDGTDRLAAYRHAGGSWPVYVSAARDRSAVLAGWREAMAPQAALAAASAALLALLAIFLARRQEGLEASNARLERRVAERTRALRESEDRLRRAQDAAGAIAFEIDPRGVESEAPNAFRALYGLPPGVPVQFATLLERIHPADRARIVADNRTLAARGGPFRMEFRVRLPNGATRWILGSGVAEPGPPGAAMPSRVIGVNIDVTERRAAEEALRESERLLRLAQQAAAAASWSWQPESGQVRWSPEMFVLLGFDPARDGPPSFEGFMALVHPQDRDLLLAAVAAWLQDEPVSAEYRVFRRTPDGGREERWFLTRARLFPAEADNPAELVGIDVDITERRRVEERFEAATTAMEGGVYEWEMATGRVTRSSGVAAVLGEEPEGTAEAWLARIHPEDREGFDSELRACIEDPACDRFSAEYRVRRADGGWAWLWDRGRVFRDPVTGDPLRALGGVVDITARRLAEERQELLMREVDHRSKNALAVVRAALRLTSSSDPVAYRAAIEGRVDALARAQSRLAETRWAGSALRQLLADALAPFVAPGATPRATLEGPEVELVASATQPLVMAFHELATNATKYGALSSPEGALAVTWRRAGGELSLHWAESGGPRVEAPPTRKGFGSRVVDATVRTQLGGRATWNWLPSGLVVEIVLPEERVVAPAGTGAGALSVPG